MILTEEIAKQKLHCDCFKQIDGDTYAYDSASPSYEPYGSSQCCKFVAYRLGDPCELEREEKGIVWNAVFNEYKVCYPPTESYDEAYADFRTGNREDMGGFEEWDACFDLNHPWTEDVYHIRETSVSKKHPAKHRVKPNAASR